MNQRRRNTRSASLIADSKQIDLELYGLLMGRLQKRRVSSEECFYSDSDLALLSPHCFMKKNDQTELFDLLIKESVNRRKSVVSEIDIKATTTTTATTSASVEVNNHCNNSKSLSKLLRRQLKKLLLKPLELGKNSSNNQSTRKPQSRILRRPTEYKLVKGLSGLSYRVPMHTACD
jgi:CRISPR/Cas system CMR subunit Cmr4 (Cas7 group RAMP superfamily)